MTKPRLFDFLFFFFFIFLSNLILLRAQNDNCSVVSGYKKRTHSAFVFAWIMRRQPFERRFVLRLRVYKGRYHLEVYTDSTCIILVLIERS